MNKRRKLVILLGGCALVAPRMMFAQPKQAPVIIGWLNADSRESSAHYLNAFKEGLSAFGWKEGSQLVIEERWADARYGRLQSLTEELARKKAALIVAAPLVSVHAAAKAAPTIPIVMATGGGDLVAAGLVKSLARPGGMITGLTNFNVSITEKYLELLLAAAPKVKRVGFLVDPRAGGYTLQMEAVQRSVSHYKVESRFAEAATPEEIEPALARLAKEDAQALVVTLSPMLRVERRRIIKLALAQRWPVVAGASEFAEAGALLSYNAEAIANYRRAAYYVDRILKGTKPGDLPIEQSTKFELVINGNTAKTLGLIIPQSLLISADKVIE